MYRILSLDGGGVYGALQAVILERIFQEHPDFLDKTDLIAGTSIGGIIALTLAKPLPASEVRGLFEAHAKEVFTHGYVRKAASTIGFKARYSNSHLERVLLSYFGDMSLGNLKKTVLVPAFELCQKGQEVQQWRAKFFHNVEGSDADSDVPVIKVALATSAAPIFFPTYNTYLDGGMVENNPAACAVAQTQDERNKMPAPSLGDIRLLSIGRNAVNHYLEGNSHDWGFLKWMRPLVEMCLDRDSTVIHYQMEKLLGRRYCRLAPTLNCHLEQGIDNWSGVPEVVKFAKQVDLQPTLDWLKVNW